MIRHWYAVEEYTQTVYVFGQRAARDAWVGEHVDPSRELRYPILARNVPASAELVHTLPWQDEAYAAVRSA